MLIPIRARGNTQTLFCVPGALGNLGWLVEFSSLMGKKYDIYGLEPAGLKNWEERQDSIEELASYYIKAIQEVQPQGPYCLLGYSFGGTVAYEMACQLTDKGEQVSHIILLDAYAPWSETVKSLKVPDFFPWILLGNMFGTFWGLTKLFDAEGFTKVAPEQYTDYTAGYLFNSTKTLLSLEGVTKLIKSSVDLIIQSQTLLIKYKSKLYTGQSEIIFFQAKQGFVGPSNKMSLPIQADAKYEDLHGWNKVFKAGIKSFDILCDHFELIESPYLNNVVEQLKVCLFKNVEAGSAGNAQKDSNLGDIDKSHLVEKLHAIVAHQLKVDPKKISADTVISNYGVSSLSSVLVLQAINDAFGLEIELDEMFANFTINKLADLVCKATNNIVVS